ncbi:MAG: SIMPL domain-containing protein [Tepidiformaceae bacterium]
MSRFNMPFGACLLVVCGVALAGCAGKTTVNVPPNTDTTGVSVSGHGEVQAPPDTGYIDVGVQVTKPTVAEARDSAATSANAVIDAIKKDGVDAKDIQTTDLSIQPQMDYSKPNVAPTVIGYTVTNTVTVKIRKLDDFNTIFDDAATAGGDTARVQNVRFGIENNQPLLQQARTAAMNDAKAKADELAKAGGVALGKVVSIAETQSSPPPPIFKAAVPAAPSTGSPVTPIETGTNSVIVDVQVRYAVS